MIPHLLRDYLFMDNVPNSALHPRSLCPKNSLVLEYFSAAVKRKELNIEGFTVTAKNISKRSLNYRDFCHYSK